MMDKSQFHIEDEMRSYLKKRRHEKYKTPAEFMKAVNTKKRGGIYYQVQFTNVVIARNYVWRRFEERTKFHIEGYFTQPPRNPWTTKIGAKLCFTDVEDVVALKLVEHENIVAVTIIEPTTN